MGRWVSAVVVVLGVGCGGNAPTPPQVEDVVSSAGGKSDQPGYSLPALVLRQGAVLFYDYTVTGQWAGRGGYGISVAFDLAVRNDAYDKQVDVVWRAVGGRFGSEPAPSTDWQRCHMSFAGLLDGNMERWSSSCVVDTGFPVSAVDLAANAQMGGKSYWDSRFGANYLLDGLAIGVPAPSPARGAASFGSYDPAQGTNPWHFVGQARTWDYEGARKLSIVYTSDGWATTVVRSIALDASGAGEWSIELPGATRGTVVEYALAYEVGGVTFWDNDGGKNHRVTLGQ